MSVITTYLNDNAQIPLDRFVVYTVSQKNDNDVPRYNFNAHQRILIIFGRDNAE